MQTVGASWLMVSLGAGPLLVALTQTASTLPYFVLALPAGAIGDIVDRRKLILVTEIWMFVVAVTLAVLTIGGVMTPILLLALTFALSAGDAIETPTWRAILPELVERTDLPAASALNGIEFNLARAVGPALAGFLIVSAGIGATFALNAVTFLGVILVVARWKRPVRTRTTPGGEHLRCDGGGGPLRSPLAVAPRADDSHRCGDVLYRRTHGAASRGSMRGRFERDRLRRLARQLSEAEPSSVRCCSRAPARDGRRTRSCRSAWP